jgi:hypothetical protein
VRGNFAIAQWEFVWALRENSSDANGQVAAFGLQVWTAAACPALAEMQFRQWPFLIFSSGKTILVLPEMGLLKGVAWVARFTLLRADSRHGPELLLRYLDAAWADCVVSVQPELRFFYGDSS